VPAHLNAEALSAIGRLSTRGSIPEDVLPALLQAVESCEFECHPVAPSMQGAWRRPSRLRLVDAPCVELAATHRVSVVSTGRALAAAPPSWSSSAPATDPSGPCFCEWDTWCVPRISFV